MTPGTLYIVATPIGNLEDLTFRALEALKSAEICLAEDTRVTKRLFDRYGIPKHITRFDEYADVRTYDEVARALARGAAVALVTDAGTPGIADPGWKLVRYVRKKLPDARIVPLPGPSSVVTALSVSGIPGNQFTFLGYPPHQKGRATFFRGLAAIEARPIILFESPHRIGRTLAEIGNAVGDDCEIFVGRELTKLHEETWTGTVLGAREHFSGARERGEFVLVLP